MPVLHVGDKSALAKLFNGILRSPELNLPSDEGDLFGTRSNEGARQLQQWLQNQLIRHGQPKLAKRVKVDGLPGNQTWGFLCAVLQPSVLSPQRIAAALGIAYPPTPAALPASLPATQMHDTFGEIVSEPAPTDDNPERIRITNGWAQAHIVSVHLPQTIGMEGSTTSGVHSMHKLVQAQMRGVWQAWQNRELLNQVSTFSGLWVPRYQRGSTRALSNHAWGTAFDVNASSNAYWHLPAFPGENGCLFEHATIAADFGFGWGGHFTRRLDGMHFEVRKVLSDANVAEVLSKYAPV